MARILLIEDTREFHHIVEAALKSHVVMSVETAEEGSILLRADRFDLLILDLSLPARDGYSILAELQTLPPQNSPPVICMTSKSAIADKVAAFSLGADDYILKPFDPLELKARVEAKLRKQRAGALRIVGSLEIDHSQHRAFILLDNTRTELSLTLIEFKLLSFLTQEPERVFTREQLLKAGWNNHANVLERAVDVHVSALRKKLGPLGNCLKAVTGLGYKYTQNSSKKASGAA